MKGRIKVGAEVTYLSKTYTWPDLPANVQVNELFDAARHGGGWMCYRQPEQEGASIPPVIVVHEKSGFELGEAEESELVGIVIHDAKLLAPLAKQAREALAYYLYTKDSLGRKEGRGRLVAALNTIGDEEMALNRALWMAAESEP